MDILNTHRCRCFLRGPTFNLIRHFRILASRDTKLFRSKRDILTRKVHQPPSVAKPLTTDGSDDLLSKQ